MVLQIISLYKFSCRMLREPRTTEYFRDKHKSPILVQMKGNVFLCHFQHFSRDGHDFFGFRSKSNRLNQNFAVTFWSPSFHKQVLKSQCSVPHPSTPQSSPQCLFPLSARGSSNPGYQHLFNKIRCITYSFQLENIKTTRNNLLSLRFL